MSERDIKLLEYIITSNIEKANLEFKADMLTDPEKVLGMLKTRIMSDVKDMFEAPFIDPIHKYGAIDECGGTIVHTTPTITTGTPTITSICTPTFIPTATFKKVDE